MRSISPVRLIRLLASPSAAVDQFGNFDGIVSVKPGVNQVQVTATDVNHANVSTTHTYQITVNGALISLSGVAYDANGNMTADGTGLTYEYDSLDRLTAVNESATKRSEFAYDGLGRRVGIIERAGKGGTISSTEDFVYDGLLLIQNRDASNAVQQSYFLQGEQWAGGSTAGNYYYTRDHLGSIREFVDGSGAVRARYGYDLWGNRTKLGGDLDSDFGFTGYWYHAPSNLYLSLTRPLSPSLGRFIARDPIEELGGSNLYVYAANNPPYFTDFFGLGPWADAGAVTGFIVGLAADVAEDVPTFGGAVVANIPTTIATTGAGYAAGAAFENFLGNLFNQSSNCGSGGGSGSSSSSNTPTPPSDPTQPPGEGWEWRGNGPPGSEQGSWYNPTTEESLHPDLNHPDPIGPIGTT
jgi:RHS repeat-associated protein